MHDDRVTQTLFRTRLEGDVGKHNVLLGLLLVGEIPDDLGDVRSLALHRVLGEPRSQLGQGQREVLDGILKRRSDFDSNLCKNEGTLMNSP